MAIFGFGFIAAEKERIYTEKEMLVEGFCFDSIFIANETEMIMRSNMKRLILIFSLYVLISSCSKSDNSTSSGTTKTQLLIQKPWLVTGIRYKATDSAWVDYFAIEDPCHKDNLYKFNDNGVYQIDAGTLKCDINESQITDQGSWQFSLNETTIILDYGKQYEIDADIENLDNNFMKWSYQSEINNIVYTYEYTFSH